MERMSSSPRRFFFIIIYFSVFIEQGRLIDPEVAGEINVWEEKDWTPWEEDYSLTWIWANDQFNHYQEGCYVRRLISLKMIVKLYLQEDNEILRLF